MQLDKLVTYHQALADLTRLKIVLILKEGEMHGQGIADLLHISPPTVTHHMMKLREAGIICERREKNTIYFSLNHENYLKYASDTRDIITVANKQYLTELQREEKERFKQLVLKSFFTSDQKLKSMPAKYKKKLIVLEKIAEQFEFGKTYAEHEVNERIKLYFDDYATIRREFIMQQFMCRKLEQYELNPRQLWVNWEDL